METLLDDTAADVDPRGIFNAAPRELTRIIALDQAVDLIRTTVDVVEQQIGLVMPRSDRLPLATAILHYSREIAFVADNDIAECVTAETDNSHRRIFYLNIRMVDV